MMESPRVGLQRVNADYEFAISPARKSDLNTSEKADVSV
jgi:hypothetical protein